MRVHLLWEFTIVDSVANSFVVTCMISGAVGKVNFEQSSLVLNYKEIRCVAVALECLPSIEIFLYATNAECRVSDMVEILPSKVFMKM